MPRIDFNPNSDKLSAPPGVSKGGEQLITEWHVFLSQGRTACGGLSTGFYSRWIHIQQQPQREGAHHGCSMDRPVVPSFSTTTKLRPSLNFIILHKDSSLSSFSSFTTTISFSCLIAIAKLLKPFQVIVKINILLCVFDGNDFSIVPPHIMVAYKIRVSGTYHV